MTPDSVVRIFMPVIDAPNHLQLHATIDWRSFTSSASTDLEEKSSEPGPSVKTPPYPVFWLDRNVFLSSGLLEPELESLEESEITRGQRRRLKDLAEEDWELFGFVTKHGSLVVRALTVRFKILRCSSASQLSHRDRTWINVRRRSFANSLSSTHQRNSFTTALIFFSLLLHTHHLPLLYYVSLF